MLRTISFLLLTLTGNLLFGDPVKVACVGDSITFGSGINEPKKTYPYYLGILLGKDYEVKNFGNPGKTAGDYPSQKSRARWYGDTKEHQEAIKFQPDIFICNLGINDTGAWWNGNEFKTGFDTLLQQWKQSNEKAKFFGWGLLGPDYRGPKGVDNFPGNVYSPVFEYSGQDNGSAKNRGEAEKIIKNSAHSVKMQLFDAYTPLANHPEWYKDGLHPTEEGAKKIANVTYATLVKHLKIPQKEVAFVVKNNTMKFHNPHQEGIVMAPIEVISSKNNKVIYSFDDSTVLHPGETISINIIDEPGKLNTYGTSCYYRGNGDDLKIRTKQ